MFNVASNQTFRFVRRAWSRLFVGLIVGLWSCLSVAQDADIFMLLGRAEVRESAQGPWTPATQGQKLRAGNFIRTLEGGQIALLLRDQTQIRLNQLTTLEIKAVQAGEEGTSLSLLQGRLWAQVKQVAVGTLRGVTSLTRPTLVRVGAPTATIGIRGTDWELVVDERGTTTVTVLSGEVEMANAQGQVAVGPNEQAVAEAGKAPIKSLLTNARDRVQWVTAYRPDPARWAAPLSASMRGVVEAAAAGDYASALAQIERLPASRERTLALADMHIFLGRAGDAVAGLGGLARDGQGDAVASALLVRALIVAGRLDDAARVVERARAAHPGDLEVLLADGELARLQGDSVAALRAFGDATSKHPASAEAWFGLGRVETERENVANARRALEEAIRLAPGSGAYYGERATLLALTGDMAEARTAFDDALKRQPDDYLALTGLGILQLKLGETEAALQSFLRAGTIEPRFARAQMYVGVAYYQQGNRERALESVRKAAELDPKDPMPHLMLGLMHGDGQDLGAAVQAAVEAQERMPFLKSLNQLLNNQRGSSNVGAALSARGMDEWGRSYATDSYNPFWAGSALFLADRYTDGFNKNSELYKGFLLDPTVFGASNRFSSLLPVPGHYGSLSFRGQHGDFNEGGLIGTLNGLVVRPVPTAYSLIVDGVDGHGNPDTVGIKGNSLTFGLGTRPNYALGLFYFGTMTDVEGHFHNDPVAGKASLTNTALDVRTSRQDLGASYRFAPDSQMMLKFGNARQRTAMSGALFDTVQAAALPTVGGALAWSPVARLDDYTSRVTQSDGQARWVYQLAGGTRLQFGLESARESRSLNFVRTFDETLHPVVTQGRVRITAARAFESDDFHLSARFKPGPMVDAQIELAHQSFEARSVLDQVLDVIPLGSAPNPTIVENVDARRWNPRLGLRWNLGDGATLRGVYQRWTRPVGPGTLASTDTVGIPIEDRLVDVGGQLQRARVQYDLQLGRESFIQLFADHRQAQNVVSQISANFKIFGLTELDTLRARKPVFGQAFDDMEDTPSFGQGEVSSLGVVGNWLLGPTLSLATRYTYASSRNTAAAFTGNSVPLIPRHFVNATLFWQPARQWLVSVASTYRSARYTDEANASQLASGWTHGLASYWESEDKRLSVEAGLFNLHANKASSADRKAKFEFIATWRY